MPQEVAFKKIPGCNKTMKPDKFVITHYIIVLKMQSSFTRLQEQNWLEFGLQRKASFFDGCKRINSNYTYIAKGLRD